MTDPESTRLIPLSHGMHAIVDAENFARLSKYRWYADTKSTGISYAQRAEYDTDLERYLCVGMHREIMGLKYGDKRVVDHINDNGLDNTKSNLRVCTHAENIRNSKKRRVHAGKPPSSRYKGVSYESRRGKWKAYISLEGKLKSLGYFSSETAAARAYNDAASRHGETFTRLNNV